MALIRLYTSTRLSTGETKAETLPVDGAGMTSWSTEELKLLVQPPADRPRRMWGIWQAFRKRRSIRQSGLYDKNWYTTRYADVRTSGMHPDLHFLLFGMHEGRDPGPNFSQLKYVLFYKDVLLSRANPLLHYILHGQAEGRYKFPADQ